MTQEYPFYWGDRLGATMLDHAFELSFGPTPPVGSLGGARQFKQWMDTSTSPPTLRIATATQASTSYVASEWAALGTLNISTRQFTFTGALNTVGNTNLTAPVIVYGTDGSNAFRITGTNQAALFYFQPQSPPGTGKFGYFNGTGPGILELEGTPRATTGYSFADQVNGFPDWNLYASGGYMALTPAGAGYAALEVQNGDVHAHNGLYADTGGVNWNDSNTANEHWQMVAHDGVSYWTTTKTNGWSIACNWADLSVRINTNFFVTGTCTTDGFSWYDTTNSQQWQLVAHDGQAWLQTVQPGGWCLAFDYSDFSVIAKNDLIVQGGGTAISAPNGDINTAHNLVVGGSIQCAGHLWGSGDGSAGLLQMYNDTTVIGFRWDGNNVFYRLNGSSIQDLILWGHGVQGVTVQADGASPTGQSIAFQYSVGASYLVHVDAVSDARLKENIHPSSVDALADICAIPVRAFDWNKTARKHMPNIPKSSPIGLVAQEVKAVMPYVVGASEHLEDDTSGLPRDTHSIIYEHLAAYLVRAVQQIADRLDAGGL